MGSLIFQPNLLTHVSCGCVCSVCVPVLLLVFVLKLLQPYCPWEMNKKLNKTKGMIIDFRKNKPDALCQ